MRILLAALIVVLWANSAVAAVMTHQRPVTLYGSGDPFSAYGLPEFDTRLGALSSVRYELIGRADYVVENLTDDPIGYFASWQIVGWFEGQGIEDTYDPYNLWHFNIRNEWRDDLGPRGLHTGGFDYTFTIPTLDDLSLFIGPDKLDISGYGSSDSDLCYNTDTDPIDNVLRCGRSYTSQFRVTYEYVPVPQPAALPLFLSGLIGLVGIARGRARHQHSRGRGAPPPAP
jgi:hypothetical protein